MSHVILDCTSGGTSAFRSNSQVRVTYTAKNGDLTVTEVEGVRWDGYRSWSASDKSISINVGGTNKSVSLSHYIDFNSNWTAFGAADTSWGGLQGRAISISVKMPSSSVNYDNAVFSGSATMSWDTYTISYNANGGTGAPNSQTKTHGTNLTLSSTKPTRSGYTFQGWSLTKNGDKYYDAGGTCGKNENLTLWAVWKANDYTYNVVYKSSTGKSLGTTTVKHTFGGTYSISAPAKTGYSTPNSQSIAWDSTTAKTITFTYPIINYTISYELDGGTATGNPSSYNIESKTITLKTPTKTRYDFVGWTGSNGNTPSKSVSIPAGSTGNKSYTANWVLLASRITVYTQEGAAHRGLVHIYDDDGNLHYGILTVYDSNGKAHVVI